MRCHIDNNFVKIWALDFVKHCEQPSLNTKFGTKRVAAEILERIYNSRLMWYLYCVNAAHLKYI